MVVQWSGREWMCVKGGHRGVMAAFDTIISAPRTVAKPLITGKREFSRQISFTQRVGSTVLSSQLRQRRNVNFAQRLQSPEHGNNLQYIVRAHEKA